MVRKLLNGRFANTAFAVFDPQGKRQLTRSGRSPGWGLGDGRRGPAADGNNDSIVAEMNRIARRYKPEGKDGQARLQDFNSLRQALNVASADQRLLVLVNASSDQRVRLEKVLRPVFSDKEIVGKFHLNFIDQKTDRNWAKSIQDAKSAPGIMVIRSGQFGLKGQSVAHLTLDSDEKEIKSTLLEANRKFARIEKRKDYASHVREGRRQGIYFENEIPYGEDRDGDGKADQRKSRGRQR